MLGATRLGWPSWSRESRCQKTQLSLRGGTGLQICDLPPLCLIQQARWRSPPRRAPYGERPVPRPRNRERETKKNEECLMHRLSLLGLLALASPRAISLPAGSWPLSLRARLPSCGRALSGRPRYLPITCRGCERFLASRFCRARASCTQQEHQSVPRTQSLSSPQLGQWMVAI